MERLTVEKRVATTEELASFKAAGMALPLECATCGAAVPIELSKGKDWYSYAAEHAPCRWSHVVKAAYGVTEGSVPA